MESPWLEGEWDGGLKMEGSGHVEPVWPRGGWTLWAALRLGTKAYADFAAHFDDN